MSQQAETLTAALADRYRVERELGQGGMATVYLAQDLRHERRVAIKVLRPELAAVIGADRFVREIRTVAGLQHPHILGLIDSGEVQGTAYYVMPFVEGESLRDRLQREKQLPIGHAVRIATEVASALDYAHRHGVIHRDIKPENILLHDGQALVADFGIALAVSQAGGSRMTETGMSLGTPHYMSPEQAMGEREITARSDVYALGAVTYEMLTGDPPFTGSTAQAIVAKVLTEKPAAIRRQRERVPESVEEAVLTALEKLPADRFATAAEFAQALGGAATARRTSSTGTVALRTPSPVRLSPRSFLAIALAVIASGLAVWGWLRRPAVPAPAPVARFAVRLSPPPSTGIVGQAIALAPDGSRFVYVASAGSGTQLFSRSLDQLYSVPITGTAGAVNPFFSPDGTWLGFRVGSRLFKIALGGGPPLPICNVVGQQWGASWSRGDTILFADQRGLLRVPAGGGVPTLVAASDSAHRETYRWPELLPGERTAVFALSHPQREELAAVTLATGQVKRLGVLGGSPRYVRQGYVLVTALDSSNTLSVGVVTAVPFDAARLTVTGPPVAVTDSVQTGGNSRSVKMGVSRDGAMVLATGRASQGRLVLSDRSGKQRPLTESPRLFLVPRFSPDGRRIAVGINDAGLDDIWTMDLKSKILTRLTFDHSARVPEWSPDGRRLVYSRRHEDYDLAWIPTDGSGAAEPLLEAPGDQLSGSLSADQRFLIVREGGIGPRRRISIVRLDSAKTIRPFLASESFDQYTPALAPNGRWLAYVSEESGRPEVYVRPFPNAGGRFQVSGQGGIEPVWARSGRELFFWTGDTLMAAQVSAASEFSVLGTKRLLVSSVVKPGVVTNYDVSPDGTTFVMNMDENAEPQVVFVLNWFDHLARPPGARSR